MDAVTESHGWTWLVADAAKDENICGECPPEFKNQLIAERKKTDVLFKFVKKVYGRRDAP